MLTQGRIVFIQFEICSELQSTVEVDVAEGSFADEIAPIWLNNFPLGFIQFLCVSCTTLVTQFLLLWWSQTLQAKRGRKEVDLNCSVRLLRSDHGFIVLAEVRT